MKRIINGKLYDTETAHELCELESTAYVSDFEWHETYLYRTKKGAFFIAGVGNAASMWAEPCGQGGHTNGEGLRVVDDSEARQYMEAADCAVDEFAAVGLDVVEG